MTISVLEISLEKEDCGALLFWVLYASLWSWVLSAGGPKTTQNHWPDSYALEIEWGTADVEDMIAILESVQDSRLYGTFQNAAFSLGLYVESRIL